MSNKLNWEPNGLYRKFTDEISGEEILESNFELQRHPKFEFIDFIINDFSEVTGFTIETEHTKTYAKTDEIAANTKFTLKVAIVVNQDPLIALANSYREEMIGKSFECEIFKTVEDARKWVS